MEGCGMMIARLYEQRFRGFRVVDLTLVGVLLVLMLTVYLAKTFGGAERSEIARVERQIDQEKVRGRLLQAEVAHLEQPGRLEALSRQYLGLQPVSAKQEIKPDALTTLGVGTTQP
jgi:cell division protein FtsL